MTLQTPAASNTKHHAGGTVGFVRPQSSATIQQALGDVLVEQLRYLVQYADQERERYERVKAILMESFN